MQVWMIYLLVMNVVTFGLYGLDKWKAVHHRWRISESALLFMAVIGGTPGALAGMYSFRHKTKHKKFSIGIPAILIMQVVIIYVIKGYMV